MTSTAIRADSIALFGGSAAFLAGGPRTPFGVQALPLLPGWESCSRFGGKLSGFLKSILHNAVGAALLVFATRLPSRGDVGAFLACGTDDLIDAARGIP